MNHYSFGYANLANLQFIEKIYQEYLQNPSSIDPSWRYFFQGMEMASSLQKFPSRELSDSKEPVAQKIIEAYRTYGHLKAQINPLKKSDTVAYLELSALCVTEQELDQEVEASIFKNKKGSLRDLIKRLEKFYCSSIGFEMNHLDERVKEFLIGYIEDERNYEMSTTQKKELLIQLNRAESFESFIHIKHPGQKRFSLEGGESLIPMLDAALKELASSGVKEVVIAMAHRGRLNVLTNIMGKSYAEVFEEFSPNYLPKDNLGSGDVKYHKGYLSHTDYNMQVELCPNPSHLEAVDPLLQGYVKAKQVKRNSSKSVCPLMIHGDASVAGQGVVYEVLQMSSIDGYSTSGTIHLVVNNQIGYTALPIEGRSTRYCTDIAKAFNMPVLHVSSEDPEACVFAGKLAVMLRQKFGVDVFIDLVCYRKYGHQEADEPSFTQPLLYEQIRKKQNVRNLYKNHLVETGQISAQEVQELEKSFLEILEKALAESVTFNTKAYDTPKLLGKTTPVTKVDEKVLIELTQKFCTFENDLALHPKVKRLFEERLASIEAKEGIDWGLSEYLAFATLVVEKYPVRMSGQDCRRGTFAHRHAAIIDQKNEKRYFPLSHLSEGQALFSIYNSLLSEYGVLGFEYGYSLEMKKGLTLWEAQFGDFANGAQIMIDQFISSGEQKWGVTSSLVMMLPHGYEGQGPEHSSARLERFLQLCAQDNMRVAVPTKPSQVFHLLREQVLTLEPKPLILLTPKALLRYGPSLSILEEFSKGGFQKVISEPHVISASRVIFTSGKVYYDLLEERKRLKREDIALIRIEQLYPFPKEEIVKAIEPYTKLSSFCYVQEEPMNMGAYHYITPHLTEVLPDKVKLCYVGRAESASSAAGVMGLHQKEKLMILQQAFS